MSEDSNNQTIEVKPVKQPRNKWLHRARLILDNKMTWTVVGYVTGSFSAPLGVFIRGLGELVMQVL